LHVKTTKKCSKMNILIVEIWHYTKYKYIVDPNDNMRKK